MPSRLSRLTLKQGFRSFIRSFNTNLTDISLEERKESNEQRESIDHAYFSFDPFDLIILIGDFIAHVASHVS